MLACALSGAWAQDTSTPPAETPQQPSEQQPQQPVPAYGQDSTPPLVNDNPPLSGLDLPSLEPHAAPLSYLQPGVTVSESADSNAVNSIGGGYNFSSITRGLGSLTLKRLWSNYDLGLDYVGGTAYYSVKGQGWKLLQQMDVDQKISWKRGQLSVRDSFSYLPEGNFGGSYGSLGSQGIGSLGNTSFGAFFGGSALGSLGIAPRILNVALADVNESLTPKSSFTAAGGYAFTHFYGNDVPTGTSFLGVSQVSAQAGYNRILTSHTQIAMIYGYQGFDYSISGVAFHSHVIQGMYGHRISGRLDFLIGAGPQITLVNSCSIPILNPCVAPGVTSTSTRLGVAGQMRLRYKFPHTLLDLSYQRYETSGSGFFAGAQSDIARLNATRPLSRVLSGFADIGYSHNLRLQSLNTMQQLTCVYPGQPNNSTPPLPLCPGINANTYNFGFIGVGARRAFGHNFNAYGSYQFNELSFDNSYCAGLPVCNRISNRQVITFGLDWIPRPIRID